MPDAFYERLGPDRYRSMVATRGPWSRHHQHAGPPAALLGGALADALSGGRITRITYEVLRPVPITELSVHTDLVRPGRRVAMAAGELRDGDGPALLARAWMIREADVRLAPDREASMPPVDAAGNRPATFFDVPWDGYHTAIEQVTCRGDFDEPGDAAIWLRSRLDITDDAPITPLQRVLVAADSGNGISARMDPAEWLFVNTDLNVHLREHPEGEWIGLDAQTRWGTDGIGLATSVLHGGQGAIGVASQGLLVEPHGD